MAEPKDKTVLVVDDEPSHRVMIRAHLEDEGYEVIEAENGSAALAAVAEASPDLMVLDIRMPGISGIDVLREIRKQHHVLPVIMMTAFGTIESAVDALKAGALDYLQKPLDMEELLIKVDRALFFRNLEIENAQQKERLNQRFDFSNIIGESMAMREVFETMALVAPSDATVLILGESGTGKELVANAIHQNSPRNSRPFIKVNCAALPETLLESELFGHEKGAFTGAVSRKKGRFELADGGSMFLDEIGEMTPTTQVKLLRVLQEREFEPLGSARKISVDVRIMAATNKDLEKEVQEGGFRNDLYYRLNVVPIHLPPLRARPEDIQLLVDFFLGVYTRKNNRTIKGIEAEAAEMLQRYGWPGNIRELENTIERSVIMCRSDWITKECLPRSISRKTDEDGIIRRVGVSLKEAEKELIEKTLRFTGENRTRSAEILGITRKTLQNKIKEYDIT
ncbi:MAG: sigma-54-dependent Fis family transcriptional regulator [Deltaproteobacteria bacterium]|nr:sigma-54-dependent Fis family transcriptional regulator [Deltaproteobacteria bacterium]